MYFVLNNFNFYIKNVKLLLLFSNFNKNLSYLLINNFLKRLYFLGFLFNNLLIIIINGSLEIIFFLNILFSFNFFDVYILLGLIVKNRTFHFELVSLNTFFFISKLSNEFCIPLINSIIISNNKFFFINKLIKINNENLKIFIKFLNFLFFLRLF